jgi:hypothetical protein
MSAFPSDWFLCGGWAVDAWLGRLTRDHGDLDITVFEDAQAALFKHLSGWQIVAHDEGLGGGSSSQEWGGRPLTLRRPLTLPAHLHCRPPEKRGHIPEDGILTTEMGFWLEIVINAREQGEWVLSDEPRVTVSPERCVAKSSWGLPTALPEVLLFFKGTAYEGTRHYLSERDHVDFERLLPTLSSDQRAWLIETISLVKADHPWLGVLAM